MNTNIPAQTPAPAIGGNFLRENWKVILGTNYCPENLKYIRVRNGVASVTNSALLIRTEMPGMEDGFYTLDEGSGFRFMPPGSIGWLSYPDVDAITPDFAKMPFTPKIGKEVISELVSFCEVARRYGPTREYLGDHENHIIMHTGGFCFSKDVNYNFAMPFQDLPLGDGVALNPLFLKLVLIEMLRYDEIVISRAERWNNSPIVFGRSWSACAMLKPMKDSSGYGTYRM